MAAAKTTIKLIVDKEGKKVLFAEAKKDFVDFLFQILSLPIGAIIKLLQMKEMPGCFSDLYRSIQSLNSEHLQPNADKDAVLNPICTVNVPLLSIQSPPVNKYYRCSRTISYACSANYVTDDPSTKCSMCYHPMSCPLTFTSTSKNRNLALAMRTQTLLNNGKLNIGALSEEGYAKTESIYLVMDNLEVNSMSTMSTFTLLKDSNVKDVGSLISQRG